MEKFTLSQILVKGATLNSGKLPDNPSVARLIDETKKKQQEVLKLKEVNQESLRLVVKL